MRVRNILLILSLCLGAYADPVYTPNCGVASFSTYMAMEGGCWLGPVIIKNFELFHFTGSNTPTAFAGTDGIIVTPEELPDGDITILFDGFTPYVTGPGESRTFQLYFTIDPPPIIAGEEVSLDPPFGSISVKQAYCLDSLFFTQDNACDTEGYPQPLQGDGSIGSPIALFFNSPAFLLDTRTTVVLNPGKNIASGFDGLLFKIDLVQATPEPASVAMCGVGAVAVFFLRRRRAIR